MDEYDIAIVGAGPIGCYIAQRLAQHKAPVAVFEEHPSIGEPLHCAGLVTTRVFDITHCPKDTIVQNTIYGAIIHAPAGHTLTIGGNKQHALVINRQRFDNALADNARESGAHLILGHKITAVKKQGKRLLLESTHEGKKTQTRCNLLIGADGAHSFTRKAFDFPRPKETLHGIGAELIDTTLDPSYVHIYVGHHIAPGFFAWVIPTNAKGTTARIGLCTKTHAPQPLTQYLTVLQAQPLLTHTTITRKFAGAIPLGSLKKTVHDRVLLVGDAAAQVKPTSGGGLYPGLLCAAYAADVAQEALIANDFTSSFLGSYHTHWTKDIGRELSLGMRFRNMYTRLTDDQFNKYITKFDTPKIRDTINRHGDIDYPSQLAFPLIKAAPSLLGMMPHLLKRRP